MNTQVRKSALSRFTAMIFSAFVLFILSSFCTVTASAAEIEPAAVSTVMSVELEADNSAPAAIAPAVVAMPVQPMLLFAAGGTTPAAGSGSGSTSADSSYKSVVNFFVTWIRRIGALVAFIGAIMFALGIKDNNNTETKQQGVLTMVAGFVVIAITTAISMFDLFS